MPTSTYTPIATYTVPSNVASYTFTGVPSTYTDLILISNIKLTSGTSARFQLNGDTAANYTFEYFYAQGGNVGANTGGAIGAQTGGLLADWISSVSTTYYETAWCRFNSYASSTQYKTALVRSGSSDKQVETSVSVWRSNAAVTSIKLYADGAANYVAGSTFTLYGILKA